MGGGLSGYASCDNIFAKGLGGGAWSGTWSGVGGGLSYANCDNISVGCNGAWSSPGTFVGPSSSNESCGPCRFCGAVVTFVLRRTSGLSRATTGAASAKLMMESISRVRVSIFCHRIFVIRGVD